MRQNTVIGPTVADMKGMAAGMKVAAAGTKDVQAVVVVTLADTQAAAVVTLADTPAVVVVDIQLVTPAVVGIPVAVGILLVTPAAAAVDMPAAPDTQVAAVVDIPDTDSR
jgi:hypothetical protein